MLPELDYAPDYSPFTPNVLQSVSDFVPISTGAYATTGGPTTEGYTVVASSTDVIGSAVVKTKNGTAKLYAGTASKIYQANGTTGWTDRSGTSYSATGTWEFLQLGDTTYAANGADTLQKATSGNFGAVSTAPIARSIITHENAIIALNLSTDSAGWARSDTGSDTFTVTAANDADSGTFLGGSGPVTAGTTWQNLAIAFKVDWMYGGRFVGDPDEKVRWDTLARGVGCVGQQAHISVEPGIIFVSNRDILLFDGDGVHSIADKVRRSFIASLSPTNKSNIVITHDETDRIIYIWFPLTNDTYPTSALAYNYKNGKWGTLKSISGSASYTYIRCRVQSSLGGGSVNYPDYTAVGGTTTNASASANVVWAHSSSGGRLVNYSRTPGGSGTRSGSPAMTSAIWGQQDKDSNLSRIYFVPDSLSSTVTPSSVSVITMNSTMLVTGSKTAGTDDDGNAVLNTMGRFHYASVTWGSGLGTDVTLRSIVPQFLGDGGRR